MSHFELPSGYPRVKVVESFDELVSTRFEDGVNALCWKRSLNGDFGEVVDRLSVTEGITTLDATILNALALSESGRLAREVLLADLKLLQDQGLAPVLDCIHAYPHDEEPGPVRTDVYSFHADSATVEADTFLCSYNANASEGLRNDEARRYIDIPEVRGELLKYFGGTDNGDFEEFLIDNCYDLHYAPLPQARPFSFGIGNMWRIATDYPGSPVPPCIHRAPITVPGQPSRLLLIS